MWVTYVGLVLLGAVCAFAWWKGEMAERLGCGIYCWAWILTLAAEWQAGDDFPVVAMLSVDALAAAGFLVLAIRYNNLWLGAVMMLQGMQLGLHAMYFTSSPNLLLFGYNLFALMLNLISLAILITIAGGIGASAMKRRKSRQRAQGRERPPSYAASPAN